MNASLKPAQWVVLRPGLPAIPFSAFASAYACAKRLDSVAVEVYRLGACLYAPDNTVVTARAPRA